MADSCDDGEEKTEARDEDEADEAQDGDGDADCAAKRDSANRDAPQEGPQSAAAAAEEEDKEEEAKAGGAMPSTQLSLMSSREFVASFLRAFLERFSQFFTISEKEETLWMEIPGGELSEKGLNGPKRPKHIIEASWISDVLQRTLKEVEETGSFSFLSQVVADHEAATRKIPESIEHLKSLNAEMHLLRHQIHTEDLAHKEAIVSGSRTLNKLKQGIKILKEQNKRNLSYKADIAIAKADCKRRLREERLSTLRDELSALEMQVEAERRINVVCADFLKHQNLKLMEEAISLATGHETDVVYMDVMLNKLREQKVEKEQLLAELEPRYEADMLEHEAYMRELNKANTMSIDELRQFETRSKAATKIQKIWRGHSDRAKHVQEIKKIAKKRKELKRKQKLAKEAEKDKKGGGKKAGGKKK